MSALAHAIETHGVATVAIGLVREHLQRMQPPRALWVPFPLGRPLGEPADPPFQRRVLMQALGLLERRDGPVLLEDFAEDAPSMRDTPGWAAAPQLAEIATPEPIDIDGWTRALAHEMAQVLPFWHRARERFGRTTVGLSAVAMQDWPETVASFLNAAPVRGAAGTVAPALVLRGLADDLKAFYMEAAQAEGPAPSGRQVDAWFWRHTRAASLLRAVRAALLASPDAALQIVGSRFLVPTPYLAVD